MNFVKESIENEFSDKIWTAENKKFKSTFLKYCQEAFCGSDGFSLRTDIINYFLKNAPIYINTNGCFADRMLGCDVIAKLHNEIKLSVIRNLDYKNENKYFKAESGGLVCISDDINANCPDYANLLKLGLSGLILKINAECLKPDNSGTEYGFYENCLSVLYSVKELFVRFSDAAQDLKVQNDCTKYISSNFINLSKRAPQHLGEALQLIDIWFFLENYCEFGGTTSLSRIDEILYPFYVKDIQSGNLNKIQAEMLLSDFLYRMECANKGSNVFITLSGLLNKDSKNPVTEAILNIIKDSNINNITFCLAVNSTVSNELIKKVYEIISGGNNSILLCNDRIIKQSLLFCGTNEADIGRYAITNYCEPIIPGSERSSCFGGTVNLCKALELTLNNGVDMLTGEQISPGYKNISELKTFESFLHALEKQIAYALRLVMERESIIEKKLNNEFCFPLMSATAKDIPSNDLNDSIGTNSLILVTSFATLIDSLSVIYKYVYKSGRYTLSEFVKILRDNWQFSYEFRNECSTHENKYGNNMKFADILTSRISGLCSNIVNGLRNSSGGIYKLGIFSKSSQLEFGHKTAATPNGRYAGDPLSRDLTPYLGQIRNGHTAALLSVGAIDTADIAGGSVIDLTLSPKLLKKGNPLKIIDSLISAYFECGGFAINCSVLDADTLIAAQNNPKKYSDLTINMYGKSMSFCQLNREEQDYLIMQLQSTKQHLT